MQHSIPGEAGGGHSSAYLGRDALLASAASLLAMIARIYRKVRSLSGKHPGHAAQLTLKHNQRPPGLK